MKTNVMKRAMALILAALIVLGTLGYLFSTIAYAKAGEPQEKENFSIVYQITASTHTPINAGDQVTFEITLTPQSGAVSLEGADSVEVIANDSGFVKNNDASDLTIDPDGGNYKVTLPNLLYQNTTDFRKGKLAFAVKKGSETLETFSIDISECETDTGSSSSSSDGNNDAPLPSNMSYTLKKVYSNVNGTGESFIQGDSSKNDPTITRNRYVDMTVQFSIPGVKKTDIIENSEPNIQVLVDRGSFRFQSANDGSITILDVTEYADGVVCLVELRGLRYTGTGNTLAFTVQNKTNDTATIFQQFSTSVDSCVEYTRNDDDDDEDPDYSSMAMATPYVIVSNYSYGGTVTAGQSFPLTLTFYNTSKNIDVQNMMITLSMPEALMLTSSSNTFYVDTLGTEETVTKTVQVTAKANAEPSSHNVEVSMKYQYIDDHTVSRRDNSTQETISIPVVQVDRFEVTGVEVSPEIYLGEESDITVNYVNKGRSEVYNLSVAISGDIQNPGQQQNLGNLASGATGSADFYIMPNAEGICTGQITITYEDTNMVEKSVTMDWSANVVDPMAGMDPGMGMYPGMGGMDDPSLMPEEEEKPVWPFVAGGVAAAAVVIGLLVWRRIRKKRSELEDADL